MITIKKNAEEMKKNEYSLKMYLKMSIEEESNECSSEKTEDYLMCGVENQCQCTHKIRKRTTFTHA